ncbi:mycofactocin-coupled SDR family oxidoreductase [Georgenia sp. AZ-5]|uniref:mycofactocin-coupled SDR family oxidoreductase n=1 Tax=Georgenia sp. AZ-5 TaxID=3367526 RepID=UPI003754256C
MNRFEGKVAFITGAARGQGRNHAVRLAHEGADIIATDLCKPVDSVGYAMAEPADLHETVAQVEALGRRIIATEVDVRDGDGLAAALEAGVSALGGLDVVVANAGIAGSHVTHTMPAAMWQDMIDINLTGVWQTVRAAVPHLLARGGGSMVLISSIAGLKGLANNAHYAAAKHGVVGLMRTLANELGGERIRVNVVNPTNVETTMLLNDAIYRLFLPEEEAPTREQVEPLLHAMHALDVPFVSPDDVSEAVLFLASDEARFITGVTLPVDAGALVR